MASDKNDSLFSSERKSLPYEARPRDDFRPFRSDWRLAVIERIVYLVTLGVVGVISFCRFGGGENEGPQLKQSTSMTREDLQRS